MLLATAVDQIETECDLERSTIEQYRRAVNRFSDFIGKQATDDDLDRDNLNQFIKLMQSRTTNTTAGNYRRALCRVWNYLTEEHDKTAYEIRRLRRPKTVEQPVVAWTMTDLKTLLASAETIEGRLRMGVEAKHYFSALLLTAYDTGLRPSDLFRLRWDQLDTQAKMFLLVQHKTKKPHCVFISDETLTAIERIRHPHRDTLYPLTWGGIRRWMEKIFKIARVHGFRRMPNKNLGTLRKTNATQVYIEDGEAAAAESLGHSSGSRIVRKHYIDHRARRKYSIPTRPNAE
jgi:integrase